MLKSSLIRVLALIGVIQGTLGWAPIRTRLNGVERQWRSQGSAISESGLHQRSALVRSTKLRDIASNLHMEGLSRLHADLSALIKWVEKSGGKIDAIVDEGREGWTLHASRKIEAGEDLIIVPKSLCIFANPDLMEVPLLENAQLLMKSLDEKQWRARLAIALLSERVRPSSHFRAYLRNLPFEFWGVPVFYSTQEFSVMQDLSLMQQTRDRCRFLSEFAENVLSPLRKTNRDPFSGHNADVNAFGWGFASAASRALRNPSVIGDTNNQVMVPGIDLASHSPNPNCEVIDAGSSYILRTLKNIDEKAELTIDYGPLSNDQLLADYGFTIDNNPHDKLMVSCDGNLLNTARMVMGQVDPFADIPGANKIGSSTGTGNVANPFTDDMSPASTSSAAAAFRLTSVSAKQAQIGRGGNRYDESWLHQWQLYWLAALQLHGPNAQFAMGFGGPGVDKIDQRLWAFLRILYARTENDLLKHGYDPYLLQRPGSCIDSEKELQVIKTMVGVVGVLLRVYGTDLDADMAALKSGHLDLEEDAKVAGGVGIMTASSDDIITDVHRILRNVFEVPHPLPFSPTARRATLAAMAAAGASAATDAAATASVTTERSGTQGPSSFREGVASASTPYSVAVADSASVAAGETWSPSAVISKLEDGSSVEQLVQKTAGISPRTAGANTAAASASASATIAANTQAQTIDSAADSSAGSSKKAVTEDNSAASNAAAVSKKYRGTPYTDVDVGAIGLDLPVNVREALRFRIRKKRTLHRLIWELGQVFENLRQSALQLGTPVAIAAAKEELLPGAVNFDKGERRAKIRELVDEVRQKSPKEDLLLTAGKIAEKWSDKGLAL